jgi:hypothetical protein
MLIAFLFLIPASAFAGDPWWVCEKSIRHLSQELYRIASEVDEAEPENLGQIQLSVTLPPGMECPADRDFEDMPTSLRKDLVSRYEDFGGKRQDLEKKPASEVLVIYQQRMQAEARAKFSSTFSTKVTGALEQVRDEKAQLLKVREKIRRETGY